MPGKTNVKGILSCSANLTHKSKQDCYCVFLLYDITEEEVWVGHLDTQGESVTSAKPHPDSNMLKKSSTYGGFSTLLQYWDGDRKNSWINENHKIELDFLNIDKLRQSMGKKCNYS